MSWSPLIKNKELKCEHQACGRLGAVSPWFLGHLQMMLLWTVTHTLRSDFSKVGNESEVMTVEARCDGTYLSSKHLEAEVGGLQAWGQPGMHRNTIKKQSKAKQNP